MSNDLKLSIVIGYDDAGLARARADLDAFGAGVESASASALSAVGANQELAGSMAEMSVASADLATGQQAAAQASEQLAAEQGETTAEQERNRKVTDEQIESFQKFAAGSAAVAAGITAIGAGVGAATMAASEYNAALTNVATLNSKVVDDFAAFNQGVLEVSASLGQDAVEATTGLYNAISAGIDPDNGIAFLETAGKAAVAGVTDINTAVSALTVGVNAWNLSADEADRVSDAMFTTVRLGVTTFGELGSQIGSVAGIAASAGVDIEQTGAALAQITTKGFSTGQATTALKAGLIALQKPSAELDAIFQQLGYTNAAAAVESEGLQFALEAIRESSDATGTPLISLLGRAEAVNLVLATTGDNAQGARDKLDEFTRTAGATSDAFDLISVTPQQKYESFKSTLQGLTITIGNAFLPVMEAVLDAFTPLAAGATKVASVVGGALATGFGLLPGPLKLVVGGLVGFIGVAAAATTVIVGLTAALAPGLAALGLTGPITTVAAGGFATLSAAAGTAAATVAAFALPLTAIVAVIGAFALAAGAAGKALDAEFDALDKTTAGFDDYAAAAQRAHDNTGLFGRIGFEVRGIMGELGDETALAMQGIRDAGSAAVEGLSGLGSSIADALGWGKEVEKDTESLTVSTQATIEAGKAWIEYGTNIDPATLKSREFKLAQAQLNEDLRAGKIDQSDYNAELIKAADAAQVAAGGARVLSIEQQELADKQATALRNFAVMSLGLSDVALASDTYTRAERNLAEQVAQGNISRETARASLESIAEGLNRTAVEYDNTLRAQAATLSGFNQTLIGTEDYATVVDDLSQRLATGAITMEDARAELRAWSDQVSASVAQAGADIPAFSEIFGGVAEQVRSEVDALGAGGFAGVGIPVNIITDSEDAMSALGDLQTELREGLFDGFQGLLDAEADYNASRASAADSNAERLAKAEAEAQKKIAEAQASGDAERVAKEQSAAAERLAAISTENAQRLAEIDSAYQAERAQRIAQIGQSQVDYITGLVQTGQITTDKGKEILGALQSAFPGAEIASAANVAAIEISGAVNAAVTGGSAELAALASQGADTIDSVLNDAEATVREFEAETTAAFQAAVASGSTAISEAASGVDGIEIPVTVDSEAAADAAAAIEGAVAGIVAGQEVLVEAHSQSAAAVEASLGTVSVAHDATAGVVEASGARQWEILSQSNEAVAEHADATEEAEGRTREQMILSAEAREVAGERQRVAVTATADTTDSAAGDIVDADQRIAEAGEQAAGVVDDSIGKIGDTYLDQGSSVAKGTDQIVTETDKANVALGNIGTQLPQKLAPAGAALDEVAEKSAVLADVQRQAGDVVVTAQEDQADSAEDSAGVTVTSFEDVEAQADATTVSITELTKAFEGLPKLIEAEYRLTGVDRALADLQEITRDLDLATGTYTLTVRAAYQGEGPMRPVQSIQLQHDIEDAIAAAEPGVNLAGSYVARHPFMESDGDGLSLTNEIREAQAVAAGGIVVPIEAPVLDPLARILFFDPDSLRDFVRTALSEGFGESAPAIVALVDRLRDAEAATRDARAMLAEYGATLSEVLSAALQGDLEGRLRDQTTKAAAIIDDVLRAGTDLFNRVDSFPGLRELLETVRSQFTDGLGPDFIASLRLVDPDTLAPITTIEQVQARLAALADEPERQRALWDTVREAIGRGLTAQVQDQIDAIEAVRSQLAATEGTGSPARAELLRVANELRETLDQVAQSQERSGASVQDELDTMDQLLDLVKERERSEKEAERALRDRQKTLEDEIEARRDLAVDSEKDVHSQTIGLLEDEADRREDLFDARMEALDDLRKATEQSIEDSIAAEQRAHDARMAQIEAEVVAREAAAEADGDALDRAKDLITILETGGTLSGEQRDLLRSLGIDPDAILAANAGLVEAEQTLDAIADLISRLPDGDRTRTRLAGRGGIATDEQLRQIRDALDSGLVDRLVAEGKVDDRARRLLEIALAGGEVRASALGDILQGITSSIEDQGDAQDAQNNAAEERLKLLGAELSERERIIEAEREAVDVRLQAERDAFDAFKVAQQGRLDAIDEQERALREAYDAEKQAIADAKEAERDRHDARMEQIREAFALELLRLEIVSAGGTADDVDAAWQEILDRAEQIAREADARFRRIIQGIGSGGGDGIVLPVEAPGVPQVARDLTMLVSAVRNLGVATASLAATTQDFAVGVTESATIGAGAVAGATKQIELGAVAASRSLSQLEQAMENFRRQREARDARAPLIGEVQTSVDMRRFLDARRRAFEDAQSTVDAPTDLPPADLPPTLRVDAPPALPVAPVLAEPDPFLDDPPIAIPVDPVLPRSAGLDLQDLADAFLPLDDRLATLTWRAERFRDIIAAIGPEFAGAVPGGDVVVQRNVTFNGDVVLTDDLADELGLIDAGRIGP